MEKFISADSHIVEPRNLFLECMDKRFRHRAPRFETRADADYIMIDGLAPRPSANFMGGFADQRSRARPWTAATTATRRCAPVPTTPRRGWPTRTWTKSPRKWSIQACA